MKWQTLNTRNLLVAIEKFGGHLCVANAVTEQGERKSQFSMHFYTSGGILLNKTQFKNGPIILMDWSPDSEQLIIVTLEGRIFFYSLFGEELEHKRFTMEQEVMQTKIYNCKLFDSYVGIGLCCLTNMNRFYFVNNLEEPKQWRMPEVVGKSNSKPDCWIVVSKDRKTKTICTYGKTIYVLEKSDSPKDMKLTWSLEVNAYNNVVLCPNKRMLAFLSKNGILQICDSNIEYIICECDTKYRIMPKDVYWCGESAVVLSFPNILELIDTTGDTLQFPIENDTYIVEEIDGLRLFDSNRQEFLCKVPDNTVKTFQVAALSPSATLLEAWKEYESGSYKSYDYIKMTQNMIVQAIETCVEAARADYDVENQLVLLKAAALGKLFAPKDGVNQNTIVDTTRTLKLLNAVRHISIGMPLTYLQYEKLSNDVLINRLIIRGQWPLAIAVCKHLKLPLDDGIQKVLSCWVKKKIFDKTKRDVPDVLAEKIGWKLAEFPNVSLYAEAAQWAVDTGQKDLATLLLENEPNLKLKVSMLMKLDRNEKALAKVCESGDHDLIAFVILHLRRTLEKKGDLELILRKFPLAFAIYKKYCAQENPVLYKALLKQTDDFVNHAYCWMKEANLETTFDAKEKLDALKEAEFYFKQSKDDFYCQQLQEQCILIKRQTEFEENYGETFLDLSLKDTFIALLSKSDAASAINVLKKEFSVTDKQFWWWKIEALGRSGQWNELEKFANSKKSPVGYAVRKLLFNFVFTIYYMKLIVQPI